MGELIVRDSIAADLPAILSIYTYEVLNGFATFEEVAPSLQDMASRRNEILNLGFPYLVAERDKQIVGYAYASIYRPRPAYRHSVENSVYVDKDHRGVGAGGALLGTLVSRCENVGLRQIVAIIGDSGNAGSIALHQSQGFQKVGILRSVGLKFDRWVDTVIMQRPLQDGGI